MSFFISEAWAEAAPAAAPQGSLLESLLFPALIFVVFYFLLIRPQMKRAKEHKAMTEALPETAGHSLASKAKEAIMELAMRRDAVAIGPGLGLDPETQALARELALDVARPMVIDADALTALAGHLDVLASVAGPRCLTPHPGEMARLLGIGVPQVEQDRIGAARELASSRRVHVVLKGAASVIAEPGGEVYLSPTGNPGLASGGTGDVLTGMVAAWLAQLLDAEAAA